jgi:alpha-D-xyloside xylohydrolase
VPIFRVHGQFPFREIYNIAPEGHPAYNSMLYYNKLRYRLMPYIYTLAGNTYHKDYTIMRGLVMDFPKDTAVLNIGDQYMFGPSILVNPVYNYKERNKKLYLPAGQGWYDLYSGKFTNGGQWITEEAAYERMPVFVKEGSILPFGPELQYTAEKPTDTISLYVYTGKDAAFTIYEDENTNYNYEKGSFSNIPITYSEANKTLTISSRVGTFPGMLTNRTFNIVWISRASGKKMDFEQEADAAVQYNGKTVTLKMKQAHQNK